MEQKERKGFCTECMCEREYALRKILFTKTIKEREYQFLITSAVCSECGAEMNIPGLIDRNVKEIDEQYRREEGIVTVEDINNLLNIYKIGKAPASLALGFGEITISRYLQGQVPSKEYSDIIRRALSSPKYMEAMLTKHRDKVGDTAYTKAMSAAVSLEALFSISDKMRSVLSYIFAVLEEVTPLTLQKLLYYIQGIYSALYGTAIFPEECRAWVHGPVFAEVYNLFKEFKYNPIDDARFAVIERSEETLTDEERGVIDLVLNTFGIYSGKTLEKITHKEEPWINAREGYDDGVPSNEIVSKAGLQKYFTEVHRHFGIDSEAGLNEYIHSMLK